MRIPVQLHTRYNTAEIKALVDSGATDNFVSESFLQRMGIKTRLLDTPKRIYNIDDTTNKAGHITQYVILRVNVKGNDKEMRFLVTNIGKEDILFGYPWLAAYEPQFDWKKGTINQAHLPSHNQNSQRNRQDEMY